MCGITGIVSGEATHLIPTLSSMLKALAHRGPDAHGKLSYNNCLLGHTRLSIIDLESGQQPMQSSNTNVAITFNGEIYGYKGIRNKLSSYPFHTHSDTEVILALYDQYGTDLTQHLPGMFAFGIWDEDRQQLFCARDRFGEKPFYYALGKNGEFIFASEIKAIVASGLVEPELDLSSLAFYLKYRYVHSTSCIYKNIKQLPPSHSLTFKSETVTIKRYWKQPSINNSISYGEASEEFRALFAKAIKETIVADVPISLFLSGGLDSSTIAAEMHSQGIELNTIAFGFKGSPKNELPYAKAVADLYSFSHIEIVDEHYDLADTFLEMQNIHDEPFADQSNIPTYLLCQKARQHTKVALSGDGGDELLAGYTIHRDMYNFARGLKNASQQDKTLSQAHYTHPFYSMFSNNTIATICHNLPTDFGHCLEQYETGTVDDSLRIDINSFLMGDILVKTDRASMANGLEIRAPFLTKELAEFCISLPWQFKINESKQKLILRKQYEASWPKMLIERPKQGFGAPIDNWIEQPRFKELIVELLYNPNKEIYRLLNYRRVTELSRKAPAYLWQFLVLSSWMENHSFNL